MDDSQPQFELSETDFLALLVKHELGLRAYARSLVPDWELVDEVIQEASITLRQKSDQLRGANGFVPRTITVLRFKCLRQPEKLRARRPLLSKEMLETLAERGAQRSPEESTSRGQALQVCLSQFSEEHRELLMAPHSSTHVVVDVARRRNKKWEGFSESRADARHISCWSAGEFGSEQRDPEYMQYAVHGSTAKTHQTDRFDLQ